MFNRAGLCFKYDEPSAMLFALYFKRPEKGAPQWHQSLGFQHWSSISCALGLKIFYLFSIDNGYQDSKQHHSSPELYFDGGEQAVARLTKLVSSGAEYPVAGNFGSEIDDDRVV